MFAHFMSFILSALAVIGPCMVLLSALNLSRNANTSGGLSRRCQGCVLILGVLCTIVGLISFFFF